MDRSNASETPAGTLKKILFLVFGLGVLGYAFFNLLAESEKTALIQAGAALGILVYLLTFADVIVGLAFLIAGIGLSPEVSIAGLNDLRLEDFLIPALLMGWLVRVAHEREPLVPMRVKGPLFLYLGTILISTSIGLSAESTPTQRSLLVLAKYIEYFLIFLLIANNVRREEQAKALVVFSLIVALASSVLGAGRVMTDAESVGAGRIHGPMGETANIFGGYLILNLSIAIGLLLHSPSGGQRFLASGAVAALGTFVLFTYSRTSYAAQMAALAVFGFWKNRRLLGVVLGVVLVTPLLAPSVIWDRLATIGEIATGPGPSSWQARTGAWDTALERVFSHNPLFGFGLGSVAFGDVDSEYVRVLVDVGLAGLAAFTWLIVRLTRTANEVYESLAPGEFAKGYSAGYLIAFIALVIHAIAATSFTSIRTMECFMVFTGLLVSLAHHRQAWQLRLNPVPGILKSDPPVDLPGYTPAPKPTL